MANAAPPPKERGMMFDGVKVGRPATRGVVDAGYTSRHHLPDDLHERLAIHGAGPRTVDRSREKRGQQPC